MSFPWWVDFTQMEIQIWVSENWRVVRGGVVCLGIPKPRSFLRWVRGSIPGKPPHYDKVFIKS